MLLILAAALLQAPPVVPAGAPVGCDTPESRQWDFWVGTWEVRPRGADKIIAHSLVEKKYTGCAIRENWMPLGRELTGGGGSLSLYDPARRQWRQVWIDSSGTRVDFDGRYRDGVMTIVGEWANFLGPGNPARVAIHYQLLPDGQVRQWGDASSDGGKSWSRAFDFLYRRAPLPDFK